MDNKRTD